jgi:[acyl-carrier-protein] S-malonyltransferase
MAPRMMDPRKLACVFPGQGAQSIGMLHDLAQAFPIVRESFQEASDAQGIDLWSLACKGPETELNRTQNTQPVMLAAGVAVWRAWCAGGGARPAVMAGHSFGEYTALVCAGALDFREAASLVRERGRLMQEAITVDLGAMAAILGLEDAQVADVCARAARDQVVSAANFNAPGQVVIAGNTPAVLRAMSLATEAGAKRVVQLSVSVPAHCSLMIPAARRFATHLAQARFQSPDTPVVHNTDVASHGDPSTIRDVLTRQLYSPVRWVETVRSFAARGVTAIVELGPGKVLTGLNRRVDKALQCLCVHDPKSLDEALAKSEALA